MTDIPFRYYFPSATTAPAVSPAFAAAWTDTEDADRRILNSAMAGSAVNKQIDVANASVTHSLGTQFVGPAIVNPTMLSGTVNAILRSAKGSSSTTSRSRIIVKVVSNNGSLLRGVIFDSYAEFNTTGTAAHIFASGALTPLLTQANDRIVVEIGAEFTNPDATSKTATLAFGGTSEVPYVEGETSGNAGWLQLNLEEITLAVVASAGGEVTSTLTESPASVASAGGEVMSNSAVAAAIAGIGVEVMTPIGYVVSVHDLSTPIEVKHADGTWRRMIAIGNE